MHKYKQNHWVEEGGFGVLQVSWWSLRLSRATAARSGRWCADYSLPAEHSFFLLSCVMLKFEPASSQSWGPHAQRGRNVWGGVNGTHSVSRRTQIEPWSFVGILWSRVFEMSCVCYTMCRLCSPPLPCHLGRSWGNLLRNAKLLFLRCVLPSQNRLLQYYAEFSATQCLVSCLAGPESSWMTFSTRREIFFELLEFEPTRALPRTRNMGVRISPRWGIGPQSWEIACETSC
jgi:hypothetical protein